MMSESEEGEVKGRGKGGKRGAMGAGRDWKTFASGLASMVREAVGCFVDLTRGGEGENEKNEVEIERV
jgi:hypothetical protein